MIPSEISKYYACDRPEFISFLKKEGHFEQAVDIGCAAGFLGQGLEQNGTVGVCDGIEPHSHAAQLAESRLRRVWRGTIETVVNDVPWEEYDLVIMADVLEHLVDPWEALRLLADKTSGKCRLALSVPNVRHYKVVFPLLFKDQFKYQDYGIMDRTHLHFFTRSSLAETLSECGWKVQAITTHMKSRYRRWYYPTRLLEPFVAVQYMLVAERR